MMAGIIVFGGLVLIRFIAVAVGAALIIRPVRDCPACFGPTLPVDVRWLGRLARGYEWRWCPGCRWQGPARRSPAPPTRVDGPVPAPVDGDPLRA